MYSRDDLDVPARVSGRVVGPPFADRLVDRLVLVDGCGDPARHGQHVVAQPAPERLGHDARDVVGDGQEDRVVGVHRDLPVEQAVGVAPDRAVLRVLPVARLVHHREQPLHLRVGREARRGERGDRAARRGRAPRAAPPG